jgi:DNA-binding beta-propeller fold protein YncE
MAQAGAGGFIYEHIENFPKLPAGEQFGKIPSVATDSQDRLYVLQRSATPLLIFDPEGNYLNRWGAGIMTDPHGLTIVNDIAYTTDRKDSVAVIFTLDGKPLQVIGRRGVHSDTGCEKPGELVPRAAGPFNYPTELAPSPSGDLYVSDGYRNCRVHRFSRDGRLIQSWGEPGKTQPGQFHLSHSVLVAPDGKVYVGDRSNKRVQIFSPEGDFIGQWTGMNGPNHVALGRDGLFYICEQKSDGVPGYISIRDADGHVLARWGTRHAHGLCVDSQGNIYTGSTSNCSVDKYLRIH